MSTMLFDGFTLLCWNASSIMTRVGLSPSGNAIRVLIPLTRLASTATIASGNFFLICRGSSPLMLAVSLHETKRKPRLLRPYPLESTAIFSLPSNCFKINSVCGVLPVPPAETFPITIIGISKEYEAKIPLSYKKCLVFKTM
ncbi:hypothetical protein SDC9_117800 [bioreactor metagenome]|uniref:Uncharacterized protein n=1 Tax=bioreactor metagenome TaxID=1076179 RepID=A0A645BZR6_9ZZZZ